jgi:O-antigen/teichoic acid export membrane protein
MLPDAEVKISVVVLAADWIIPAVFGTSYRDSVTGLEILFLSIPRLSMATANTLLADAIQLETRTARMMLFHVAIQIVLCEISLLCWGTQGALWAAVISKGIIAAWSTRMSFRKLGIAYTT